MMILDMHSTPCSSQHLSEYIYAVECEVQLSVKYWNIMTIYKACKKWGRTDGELNSGSRMFTFSAILDRWQTIALAKIILENICALIGKEGSLWGHKFWWEKFLGSEETSWSLVAEQQQLPSFISEFPNLTFVCPHKRSPIILIIGTKTAGLNCIKCNSSSERMLGR